MSIEHQYTLFGTDVPSRVLLDQVQRAATQDGLWLFDFNDDLQTFGYYLILYQDAQPVTIMFTGMSGD